MSHSITSRVLIPIVCLLTLLSGCLGCIGDQARFKETRYMTVSHEPASAIRVITANGDVTLQVGQVQDVQIEARIKTTTQERLSQTGVVTNRVNGTLNVEVNWPDGKRQSSEACAFTITLPDATGVEVQTQNGEIKSTGLAGAARLNTSNGQITVISHNGAVNVKTSNGRITVQSVTGDLIASTSNGAIDIQNATQQVDASTSNGRVSVTLAETASGPVRVRSSNGAIDLTIGSSFSGELKMSTSNGGLEVDEFTNARHITIHKTSGSVVFGEGGGESELHTSNGRIHVHAAGKP